MTEGNMFELANLLDDFGIKEAVLSVSEEVHKTIGKDINYAVSVYADIQLQNLFFDVKSFKALGITLHFTAH